MCGPGMDMMLLIQEECVKCGKDTPYDIDTPISERKYYIEGAGQLCNICHKDIYSKEG
tara:strand:+ start:404 stop:577 length:174 start_codon:yes stop_codon:yes gene_type:complete